jgi:hypothetical protein
MKLAKSRFRNPPNFFNFEAEKFNLPSIQFIERIKQFNLPPMQLIERISIKEIIHPLITRRLTCFFGLRHLEIELTPDNLNVVFVVKSHKEIYLPKFTE